MAAVSECFRFKNTPLIAALYRKFGLSIISAQKRVLEGLKWASRWHLAWHVETGSPAVIQAHESEPRIMRYELTDHEWTAWFVRDAALAEADAAPGRCSSDVGTRAVMGQRM